ncbi:MAG: ATP-binding cassette domain-containing protein [Candidatus Aminicenantes bacterium]|nr:ATP-binding cassette domain-containing protein [Candidatus Aminicenantes bacterium]
MKVLEVENINKSFGHFKAVDNISFSIEEGVIFGLLGPNGAGKTTTIRMIMNIIIPDSGRISLMGNSKTRSTTDFIGYLPEERGMYRKMKVENLLFFQTKLKSMPKKDARKAIDLWVERMELSDWKKKKSEELSKGMQQKIQFISTVLHRPKLLILDEPFGGLDPINQNLIKDILLELKSQGTTIIFSTHILESAEKLCEEIFLINRGKQVLNGRLSDIKKSFGRKNVRIEYEGSDAFLKSDQIKRYDNYGNTVEITMAPGGDIQKVLKDAVDGAVIHKFEIMDPSLNDIFIDSVRSSEDEGAVS